MTNGEKFKSVFGFGADGSRVIAVNATWWDCEFQIRKPITNADRIRNMSDEELTELINFVFATGAQRIRSSQFWRDWLKQEVEENK